MTLKTESGRMEHNITRVKTRTPYAVSLKICELILTKLGGFREDGNYFYPFDFTAGNTAEGEYQKVMDARACINIENIINSGEIIQFDNVFDHVINDTACFPANELYLPFEAMFIDRWFEYGTGLIPGIGIFRVDGVVSFAWYELSTTSDSYRITCRPLEKILLSDDDRMITISKYVFNCINIINNSDKDIKEIERFPSHKKLDPTHRKYDPCAKKTTYITVGGELKKYIGEYNKRREAVGHNPSFIVRGHWRHFRSSRYKNKRGQSKWIYPYIKGMPEELVHRFVKIVPTTEREK